MSSQLPAMSYFPRSVALHDKSLVFGGTLTVPRRRRQLLWPCLLPFTLLSCPPTCRDCAPAEPVNKA